jgi:glycosyltransferase involved in cell wall biosynthesis
MRFLFLTQYYPPEVGAPPVRLAAITRELLRLGHRAEVVTALPNHPTGRIFPGYKGRFYVREEREGVLVHRLWLYPSLGGGLKRMLNYGSFAMSSLAGLARASRPDYLFVESPPLFLSLPAYVAARRWRVPFIFHVADLWPDSVRELGILADGPVLRFAERLERWSYRKATFVDAVTERNRRSLIEEKGVPAEKVLFLPNGVDTSLFRPMPPDTELAQQLGVSGKKVILYAGTIGYLHGAQTALDAAKLVDPSDVEWIFIGDGSEKKDLVAYASRIGLSNVRFLDPRPPEYIASLYSLALAGLCTLRPTPALSDGIRLAKVFASLASGKPMLYSGAGEGADLISDAKTGLVTPPQDAPALARAVRTLIESPRLAEELGANARRCAVERFSWPAIVESWLQELSAKGPSGARRR